jgi:hypothetical protein
VGMLVKYVIVIRFDTIICDYDTIDFIMGCLNVDNFVDK